jgi:hypothetical protein
LTVTGPLSGAGTAGSPLTFSHDTDSLDIGQSQTLTSGVTTTLLGNSSIVGYTNTTPSSGAWNSATGAYTVPASKAGWYQIYLYVFFNTSSATGTRTIQIRKNGGSPAWLASENGPSAAAQTELNIARTTKLAVADIITFTANQSSGANMGVSAYMAIVYLGA